MRSQQRHQIQRAVHWPGEPTHAARNMKLFRLDRCLARGLVCTGTRALERGPSDHHPIILELSIGTQPAKTRTRRLQMRWRALDRFRPDGIAPMPRADADIGAA